jgi:hypothetical protein
VLVGVGAGVWPHPFVGAGLGGQVHPFVGVGAGVWPHPFVGAGAGVWPHPFVGAGLGVWHHHWHVGADVGWPPWPAPETLELTWAPDCGAACAATPVTMVARNAATPTAKQLISTRTCVAIPAPLTRPVPTVYFG